jgi:hypothetical protein
LAPHNHDRPSGGRFNGTYAPVGEPSTASKADDRGVYLRRCWAATSFHRIAAVANDLFLQPLAERADQTYRGRTGGLAEGTFDDPVGLPAGLMVLLMNEVMQVAEAVRRELRPGRLNYTYFGNVVAHVRWHIIPRLEGDPDLGHAPWRENEKTPAADDAKTLAAGIAVRLETPLTDD